MPDLIITVRSEDAVMTTAVQRARAAVERAKDLPIKRCGTPDAVHGESITGQMSSSVRQPLPCR